MKKNKSSNFKMLLRQPALLLTIILIFVFLGLFVVFPLYNIFKMSIVNEDGVFSLAYFWKMLSTSAYIEAFKNSMVLGLIVALISSVVGYIFAFAMIRTEMPGKRFFKMIGTIPIIAPPFVLSLAMIFLFGRQGIISKGLFGILDSEIFGLKSLIIVQALSFFPVAYMTMQGILESLDASVEDAACNMGAGRGRTFWTVTLPLTAPGIISSFLLVFIQSLEDFANPAVLGGKFTTLAIAVYNQVSGMYDFHSGAVLSVMLLVPTILAFFIQSVWISKKSFVTVTGKPTQVRRKISEKHIVWPLFVFCALLTALIILMYGTVLLGGFVKTWGVDFNLTVEHFQYIIKTSWDSVKNSVVLATYAAPIAGVLGIAIAFLVVTKKFPGRRLMEFISMLTFALPGTVLGISYIMSFNNEPFLLTGTGLILVVVFVLRNMPVSIEAGKTTLLQIDPCIEEASTILGADSGYTFRRVTLPLLSQPFRSGLVYAFVRSVTAISSVMFLISPKWNLITARVYNAFSNSQYSRAAAMVTVMIVFILAAIGVINVIVNIIFKPRYLRGQRKVKMTKTM
ncbi:iron ABC transporter permease [Ruminococcus sp. OA3]|uniref:ABC transporter permease n=1 Tax=Ruminococcus sp. OA3 TaxID=2914164 RepID=UPI001F06D775|nr:iron ABC transporter permease [Ruminococcus sp. OA3]MCH1981352.1 iron ABC transporter permease [Ruminococcus sp. OA3]